MPERGVALVTGGSRGIGRAVCLSLARSCAVAVNYHRRVDEAKETVANIESMGGEAIAVEGDVGSVAEVEQMFGETEEALGPVSVLVNNAGIRRDGLIVRTSDDDWDGVIATNLSAPFFCARRAVRSMIRNRFGRIVNISSVAGLRGSPGQVNYSATKAGVVGITRSLAKEVARMNITVNAVAPGLIATELTTTLDEARWDSLVASIPAQRAGTPQDVAEVVAFLCSEHAGYVNGAVIVVDGAMSA